MTAVDVDAGDAGDEYPVQVTAMHKGQEKVYKAKYVLVSSDYLPHSDAHMLTNPGMRRRTQQRPPRPRHHHGRRLDRRRLGRDGHLPTH